MFRRPEWVLFLLLSAFSAGAAQQFPGVGRTATPDEIAAWDIDVRPDFKGLPAGQGSVRDGENLWEAKCSSCHGTFGESAEVFGPLAGNTTADDIKTGRVAKLKEAGPRTTLMKVATVSTLWDYIHRAMPWNAPKSLSVNEVYAVLAYLLNLGGIVPEDFTLSDKNIAEVQARMPNRNGMTQAHGLWKVDGKPDTHNTRCMKNCRADEIKSVLPDYARNAHGNLREQNRIFGEVRGVDTTVAAAAELTQVPVLAAAAPQTNAKAPGRPPNEIFSKNGCLACHGLTNKIVGPGFNQIAAKYAGKPDAEAHLKNKIAQGGAGVWGAIPMPPQPQLRDDDLKKIVDWIVAGAKP